MMQGCTSQAVFDADLERMNATLRRLGSVVEYDDGSLGIDPTEATAGLLGTYSRLLSYGYANGLLS